MNRQVIEFDDLIKGENIYSDYLRGDEPGSVLTVDAIYMFFIYFMQNYLSQNQDPKSEDDVKNTYETIKKLRENLPPLDSIPETYLKSYEEGAWNMVFAILVRDLLGDDNCKQRTLIVLTNDHSQSYNTLIGLKVPEKKQVNFIRTNTPRQVIADVFYHHFVENNTLQCDKLYLRLLFEDYQGKPISL